VLVGVKLFFFFVLLRAPFVRMSLLFVLLLLFRFVFCSALFFSLLFCILCLRDLDDAVDLSDEVVTSEEADGSSQNEEPEGHDAGVTEVEKYRDELRVWLCDSMLVGDIDCLCYVSIYLSDLELGEEVED